MGHRIGRVVYRDMRYNMPGVHGKTAEEEMWKERDTYFPYISFVFSGR